MSDDKLQSAEAEVVCGKIIGEQPSCLPVRANKNQQIKKITMAGLPKRSTFTSQIHHFTNM